MVQRYAPHEIALPESYADWVAISWDARGVSTGIHSTRVVFGQFLLAPGVLVVRQRENIGTHLFTHGASPRPFECLRATTDRAPEDGPSETGIDIAEQMMRTLFDNPDWKVDGFRAPFVVDFNDEAEKYVASPHTKKDFMSLPPESFHYKEVATLGDVLLHAEDYVVGMVFDRVASARARAIKA